MPKFEEKYVHFMWSDELKGKKCFIADSIGQLKRRVEQQDERYIDTIIDDNNQDYPFYTKGEDYFALAYHDPHYNFKVAYEQGKKIECKRKGDAWEDWNYTPAPAWLDDHEYRIMPEEKPVTNRELAMWLVQGHGEYSHRSGEIAYFSYVYRKGEEDAPIENTIRIRKWEDEEWHEPTREYLGL